MCQFFGFVSDGSGKKFMYFNWEQRQKLLKNNPKNYEPDSHCSIADFFGYGGRKEDSLNKYEFNPLTREFKVDQMNSLHDSKEAKAWVNNLDFRTIVAPLVIKPIVHPLQVVRKVPAPTKQELEWIKKWASVGASVWDSVRASVGASVWDSVRDSVWASVRASVWDSVWASVWDSVWDSVRASVWAYLSSFFSIKYRANYSPSNELWERGLVPSFDGNTWRLHAGPKAEIVWEGKSK